MILEDLNKFTMFVSEKFMNLEMNDNIVSFKKKIYLLKNLKGIELLFDGEKVPCLISKYYFYWVQKYNLDVKNEIEKI